MGQKSHCRFVGPDGHYNRGAWDCHGIRSIDRFYWDDSNYPGSDIFFRGVVVIADLSFRKDSSFKRTGTTAFLGGKFSTIACWNVSRHDDSVGNDVYNRRR